MPEGDEVPSSCERHCDDDLSMKLCIEEVVKKKKGRKGRMK